MTNERQMGSSIDKVKSLETELEMLKKENMSPQDIYLTQCQQFAQSNFELTKKNISEYRLCKKDIEDQVFRKELLPKGKNKTDNLNPDDSYLQN